MKAQKTSKHVTPKWVDRLLIAILLLIPVLYAAGFNVNYGPSMSHLGWFYRTSWGEQPTRVGQIVRFAQPDQPAWRKYILSSIKRVAEIRKDGYFVEGDNTERSQDCRDWGKDVPTDHVAGVVNWCWHPQKMWRCLSAEGKYLNWIDLTALSGSNRQTISVWTHTDFENKSFTVYNAEQRRVADSQGMITKLYRDGCGFRVYGSDCFTDCYFDYSKMQSVATNVNTRKTRTKFVEIGTTRCRLIVRGDVRYLDASDSPLRGVEWYSGEVPGSSWEICFSEKKSLVVVSTKLGGLRFEASDDGDSWIDTGYKAVTSGIPTAGFEGTARCWRITNAQGCLGLTLDRVAFK